MSLLVVFEYDPEIKRQSMEWQDSKMHAWASQRIHADLFFFDNHDFAYREFLF